MPAVSAALHATQGALRFDVTTISLGLVLFVVAYIIHYRFLHPLANVPGPFWASLTRLWHLKKSKDGDLHRIMIQLHQQHGYLVRIGPNEVSVSDPTAIKTIYGAGTRFYKSNWYSVWQGHRKFDLFGERDEKKHGQQRKLVSRAYAMETLKDLEPYVDHTTQILYHNLRQRQGQIVDLGRWVQLFAFDIIGELSFSRSFNFLESAKDDGSFQAIESALVSAAWVGQMPWIFWLNDYLSKYFGNRLALNNRHGSIRTLAAKEVNARKDRGSDRKDILAKLIPVHHEKPDAFDAAALTSMATTNIFAGSDTTAISTRAIIYFLLKNPDCKHRLIEEIDDFHSKGKLSEPALLSEANAMPYLQAVMYEALRLHPAVGMSLPRVVPQGGCTVDGVYLPAGCVIGANPWVIHRNKEVYGEDVEVFRPERWMKADTGDMQRFFFTFGSGARLCIGKNISWMEMSKLIPSLFWNFNIELADQEAEWKERCAWFVLQEGLNCLVTPRRM
ncbi:Isotrichodermin C-15 hydroxylase [Sphaceloma murrayae]|uniref:Isotrichodermin C-15 hydroxylase n=1 Tax=Sphaceloma murrayae TaxID=2082308 RepID=A0A2K1QTL8_9PEZI|nr:Isotrichodermin C-15 hydroxylase [Sphaceloma murrayae]